MHKNRIYILMVVVSVFLIALILIQLVWMKRATAFEQTENDLRIGKAMKNTEEQMRNTNYCFESYSKAYVNPGETFFMVRVNKNNSIDTIDQFFDKRYSVNGKVSIFNELSFPYPFTIDIQLKSTAIITDTANYYNERKAFYENLTGKQFNDITQNKRPIDSVFNMHLVDSLIKANLKNENIDTNFGFGFIHAGTNDIVFAQRISDSAALLQSSYRQQLFADNNFIQPFTLALIFPSHHAVHSMVTGLWLSVIIICVLLISFYLFVRLYIKQTRLAEMKSDFIHNLTHEFNTPMANIALAIETLSDNKKIDDPRVTGILNIIASESARLRENIERSLQVAQLERGNLQLHKEKIDLAQVVQAVIASYQLQCEQLGGEIVFATNGPAMICGDETHLINSIVNLLDNAIKYHNGRPEIKITLGSAHGKVVLTVIDNGKGMNNTTLKHIFEKFYRAHQGDLHNTKGFGVGLSYVKGIIEAHNGRIDVWSKEGSGTTFSIYLPKTDDNECNN